MKAHVDIPDCVKALPKGVAGHFRMVWAHRRRVSCFGLIRFQRVATFRLTAAAPCPCDAYRDAWAVARAHTQADPSSVPGSLQLVRIYAQQYHDPMAPGAETEGEVTLRLIFTALGVTGLILIFYLVHTGQDLGWMEFFGVP